MSLMGFSVDAHAAGTCPGQALSPVSHRMEASWTPQHWAYVLPGEPQPETSWLRSPVAFASPSAGQ